MYILFLFKIFPFEFSTGLFFSLFAMICHVRRARSIILETRQDTPAPIENLCTKTKQNVTVDLKYEIICSTAARKFKDQPVSIIYY